MKHALRLAFLIAIYFLPPSTAFAQKASYNDAFATIDSLAANQKVKLALELITQVNLRARNEGNTTMVIKSVMYRRLFQSYLDGNDVIAQIHLLRKDVLLAKQPEKSMLQSLLAASLWNYYSRNAYKISQRSEVAGDIGEDVATWPVQKILAEVNSLSIASIAEVSLLQNTSLDALDAILIGGKSTRYLRPNLYDLLAYDVLPIFKDKRFYVTSSLTEKEDEASKMAMKVFENMLLYHRKKGNAGAYFDGALAQLKYFRKDLYDTTANLSYLNALNALLKESQSTEVYSDILYEIARLYKQGAVKVEEHVNPQRKAFDLAEEAIRAYPKSSGASSAAALLQEIKTRQLSLKIRGFVLPGHVVDVLYRYQNIDSLHLQLYKLSNDERGLDLWMPASYKRFILRNKPVKAWVKTTPNAGDYRQHVVKDSIEGLPTGNYVLIAQNKPLLDTLNGQLITQFISFKVSNLIVAARNGTKDRQFMVFESLNGQPVKDAKVEEIVQPNREDIVKRPEVVSTDVNGYASTKDFDHYSSALVTKEQDSTYLNLNTFYGYDDDDNDKGRKKIILFTDRPLYRPGQTVFYKGIVLKEKEGESSIIVGEKAALTFKDVNRIEISKDTLVSNEYGSFHGSFVIPNGKLNGNMQIVTDFGSAEVRVEEYKRPKFEVTFNQFGEEYLLNDTVRVHGKAITLSGYALGSANVKYSVYFNSKLLVSGMTSTNQAGEFTVPFFPLSQKEIGESYAQYLVTVDVTDLAGETRSESKWLTPYKKGISFGVPNDPNEIFLGKPIEMGLSVHTNGWNPVKATVKVQWFQLIPPINLKRDSLSWDYNYSKSAEKWKVFKLALEQQVSATNGNIKFSIKEGDLAPGYYRRVITAISEQLDTAIYERVYRIFDSKPDSILVRSEWVTLEQSHLTRNEPAVFRVAGLREDTNVFYEVTANNKVMESGWLKTSPLQTLFKIPYKAAFGDFYDVVFMMVQYGEYFRNAERIYVRDLSKELEVRFLSFRDKLQPGEKETWKLKITNKLGEQKMVELAATLYDAALDILRPMNYRFDTSRFDNRLASWEVNIEEEGISGGVQLSSNLRTTPVFLRSYERINPYGYTHFGNANSNFANFLKEVALEKSKRSLARANERLKEFSNTGKLYGLIKDNLGYGIASVTIMVNHVFAGKSDREGVYAVNAKRGDIVTFSTVDFNTRQINVTLMKRYDLTLKKRYGDLLQEVVIEGYRQRARESTTGSSINVSGNDVPIGSVRQELEGKVAGVSIQNAYTDGFPNQIDLGKPSSLSGIIPRTNFSESAFFYPQLLTNAKGEIDIEFTIPESLTRFKMLGFAHTKSFETLYFTRELITQKQFAISANAPRFFRAGDTIVFSAKLNNMAGKMLKGKALLELRNALTGNVVAIFSEKTKGTQAFDVVDKGNAVLNWSLVIPAGLEAITYKVVAESGKYSDGEENTIPVLSNSILVTEALPLTVRGNTSKTFTMEKLLQSGKSATMRHQSLTLEFTANPIWTSIQALPYLMEYPYECAEQTMSRLYANSFATGILNSSAKIKAVFEEWQKSPGDTFVSNLDKNAELKSLLLEETPWVRNAGSAESRMKRLAVLFDLNRMSTELKANFEKLSNMQHANGSFPWFNGMTDNRYMTQQIVLNLSQLKYLNLLDEKNIPNVKTVLNKALIYLDGQFKADFISKATFQGNYATPLHYLYARSYSKQINPDKEFSKALEAGLDQIALNWVGMSTYEQALAALVLHRNGRHEIAMKIVNSLKDRSQQSDEMGMSWADNKLGWWWYQSPIETQALLIEVFDEVANDWVAVEEMKIWLLKNKQSNDWRTTKATTAACYALLMRGFDLSSESAEPEIRIAGKTFTEMGLPAPGKEAGTGYRKITIAADQVKPDMGTVTIKNNNKGIAFGGFYWQYFEQADKVSSSGTGITIKKELFLQSAAAGRPVLTRLSAANVLKKGDLLKVRIEIRCDRPMEYLHLKDMRSAGFEPINVLSSYKYQDGLGYYESTKDASTNFFIEFMPKGVYVFEYPLRVNNAGSFSNGLTTLQSMYAPEFTTHSEGIRVTVK